MEQYLPTMAIFFGVTLAVSLGLTPLVRRAALKLGWLDLPGEERRVHRVAVPRLGGLAIYAAFVVGVLLTFLFSVRTNKVGNEQFEGGRVLLMLLGGGVITLVMAVDDVRGLKPLPKLLWQVGAALLMVAPSLITPGSANTGDPSGTVHYDQGAGVLATSFQNPFGGTLQLPVLLGVLFSLFWIVGVTNAINWIDGLDGLAAGVTVVACLVLFVITLNVEQYTLAYVPLLLGAATLGFLPYNIHPARIFMGDSGAMFLGFTLAVISLIGGAKLAAALLVLGIPLLDGVYMIVFRLVRGRSPLHNDRGHLHHRLHDLGLSHGQVVIIFMTLCGAFGLVGMLNSATSSFPHVALIKLLLLIVMTLALLVLVFYISRRRFDKEGGAGSLRPRRADEPPVVQGANSPDP